MLHISKMLGLYILDECYNESFYYPAHYRTPPLIRELAHSQHILNTITLLIIKIHNLSSNCFNLWVTINS